MLFTRDTLEIQEYTKGRENKTFILCIHKPKDSYYMFINIRQRRPNTRGTTREKETFQNDRRVNSTEKYKNSKSVCIQ